MHSLICSRLCFFLFLFSFFLIQRSTSLLKEVRTKTTMGSRGYRVAVLTGYGKLTRPECLEVFARHMHLEVGEGEVLASVLSGIKGMQQEGT